MASKTVVFIHGLFLTYRGWDQWVSRYEAKGYKCIAVPYPGREKPPDALRKAHPDPKVAEVTFDGVLEHLERVIKGLDEPPIIMGHSFGGLFTQLLLNRGLGSAGVAIDPAPPQGVITTKFSFLKGGWALLNPLNRSSRPYLMSFEEFQYAFVNGMPLEEQQAAYNAHVAPESLRIGRGGLTGKAHIDFKKAHAPLLIIAGGTDNLIPASLNKSNFKRYKASAPSITEFKEFTGRNHYGIFGGKDWEEVADYALNWVESQLASSDAGRQPAQTAG
jgi:pimeloyl-ACP methyl ester carboxylesterase